MIVATAQFDLKKVLSAEDFFQRITKLCLESKSGQADLLLLPEYFSLPFLLQGESGTFQEKLSSGMRKIEQFINRMGEIAKKNSLTIVAGSIPVATEGPKILNRSFVFDPKGTALFQDKIHMTRFEKEEWQISAGSPIIQTFSCAGAKCAIAICYDIEFPKYSAALGAANVDVILVPSCTDDLHGYWRVRHCAQARAVENQSYVILSSICGGDSNHPEISSHHGQEAIFSPCDLEFPAKGILAEGQENREGLVMAHLDLVKIQRVRQNGTVLNSLDSQNNFEFKLQ